MENNSPMHIAYKTLIQNRIYSFPLCDELKRIIEFNQFTVIEYKKHFNSEYVSELIKKLKIEDEINSNDSFLYIKNNLRFVFINSDISDDDKCSLLLHELGHILDPLLESRQLNNSKIKKEEFANEFSHYMKHPILRVKLFVFILKKLKLIIGVVTLFLLFLLLLFMVKFQLVSPSSSTSSNSLNHEISNSDYYVTSSGKKYHEKFCLVVKYRNNLTKYTLDEARKDGYKPCLICIGEDE